MAPNQPPEQEDHQEPNQPPVQHGVAIQVPRPLAQLRHQSIIVSKPRLQQQRPTPGLIPVQTYSKATTSTPALLTSKTTQATVSLSKPILNIPSRTAIRMSSTFTPKAHSEPAYLPEEQEVPVLSLPEPQGGLNLLDLPQDAADMLGLAVQSSGLENQWEQTEGQQYIIQGDSITPRQGGQQQKFIQIGGDNYELVGDQAMLVSQEQQQQQQLVYHHEQEMLMQQQQQLMMEQQQDQHLMLTEEEEQQQILMDQEQPVYVDELGRQLMLTPEQQLLVQQQQLSGQQLQLVQGDQQQLLLAFQDQDQDVVYQDQDVMTID